MSSRRTPSEIALELFNLIEVDGRASRWELIKILGNTAQFRHWVDDFLLEDGLITEIKEGKALYYVKTDRGTLFHKLLKNGNIMRSFLKISGKRLSRVK